MPYISKLAKRLAMSRGAAIVAAVLTAACAGADATTPPDDATPIPAEVAVVQMSPESTVVLLGASVRLHAVPLDDDGNVVLGEPVTWTSSDPTIARVDTTGTIVALREGAALVRATVRGREGRSRIQSIPHPVASVEVSPTQSNLNVGQQRQLTAVTRSSSGDILTGRLIAWSTTDAAIATVDGNGLVTGRGAGRASIRATSEGRVDVAVVDVAAVPAPAAVTDLSSTGATASTVTLRFTEVGNGAGAPASYVVRYGTAPMSWATSTEATGTCAPPMAGTSVGAVRTCTVSGLNASTAYQFQVIAFRGAYDASAVYGAVSNVASRTTSAPAPAPVASVTLAPTTASIAIGATRTFTATLRDAAGNTLTGRAITWSSSSATVATISTNGVATAVAAGSVTIRATSEGQEGTATLTVTAAAPVPVASVTLTPATASNTVGQTRTYTATPRDAAGVALTGRTVTWSSTNTSVATVNASGVATAVAAGSATIRATSEGQVGTATLTVTNPAPAPVASVTLNPASASNEVGQTRTFTATLRDAAGNTLSGRTVTWSSTNTSIATVSASGVMTAVAAGSATIRATSEGQVGSATVAITTPPPAGTAFFSSNWSSSTGNTSAALTDGGKWEWLCCDLPSQIMSIVSASSVGFSRSTNVLRLQQRGTLGSQLAAPALPQSTTHWGRFYFRNDETGTWHQHPTAYNAIGSIQGIPWTRWGRSGGVEIGAKLYGHGYPYEQWQPLTTLQHGQWYRYEWQVEFVTASTYRFWPRVYDMAGNLVLDADDYKRADWTGSGHSLKTFQDAGNVFTFASPSLARRFGLGNEGPAGTTSTLGYWYIANVGLSTSGWLGQ